MTGPLAVLSAHLLQDHPFVDFSFPDILELARK